MPCAHQVDEPGERLAGVDRVDEQSFEPRGERYRFEHRVGRFAVTTAKIGIADHNPLVERRPILVEPGQGSGLTHLLSHGGYGSFLAMIDRDAGHPGSAVEFPLLLDGREPNDQSGVRGATTGRDHDVVDPQALLLGLSGQLIRRVDVARARRTASTRRRG